ncbi:MAG: glycosyltransferase family 2 protein [Anaerolineae bacterium]|nr:glycosyltransferase family 2 protein [Anaerolineae bacterium]
MSANCTIVIRAYNEEQHIGRLLTGIRQQTVQPAQVVLVDSGSTDATVAIASQFGVDVVHIQPQAFTFGRSLNLGISHAHGEFIVIASAHVYPVYPDWLQHLLAPFQEPQVALVYGKQRGIAASQFSEQQIFKRWFAEQSIPRQDHPFCNNANAAIRRALWQEHPYDEHLPALEDLAWAKWAFEQGYSVSYAAEAEIIHVHNESSRGTYNRYRREGMAFKRIYPQAAFTLWDVLRLWFANISSDLAQAKRQQVVGNAWRSILRFRWLQFWGTYQGYRQSGHMTARLRESFYYPLEPGLGHDDGARDVAPIRYTDSVKEVSDSDEEAAG